MKIISKLPKTFVIYLKTTTSEGFLRYKSYQTSENINFAITLEQKQKNASKFVNYSNVKKIAKQFIKQNIYIEIKIIDESLQKTITIV